jgi:hypothetical protein
MRSFFLVKLHLIVTCLVLVFPQCFA